MTDDHVVAHRAISQDDLRRPRGIELRYLLTDLLASEPRIWRVQELVVALSDAGFHLSRPGETASKLVSSALRWEVGRGRAVRCGWGRYRIGDVPDSTMRRIRRRSRQRRSQISALPGEPIWPAVRSTN